MKRFSFVLILVGLASLLSACTPTAPAAALSYSPTPALSSTPSLVPSVTPIPSITPSPTITETPTITPTPTETPSPTPDTRPDPNLWTGWPILPTVSGRAKEIYQSGLAKGNDPKIFSAIGDCQSEPNVFLGIYETNRYWFAEGDKYLQASVDFYKGSFSRKSLAVRDGLSAPSALSPLWADKENCQATENPVACELRVRKPSIIFVNLGTNWKAGASAKKYEEYLRQIVDMIVANGTLPILSTKADNVEGDNSLNLATARVAHDYDIPLYNFWQAASFLDNHGLDASRDNVYLTPDGWDMRNYYALRVLDVLRTSLNPQ